MNFICTKTIETTHLLLRPTIESDLKVLWEILCIPEVNKYYLISKFNLDWEKEKEWQYKKLEHATDKDVFCWSVVLKKNNECIGQISIQEKGTDKSIRDIGWFINPKYQRKGYTYEAAKEIIKYMFEEVEINGIETSVAVPNRASRLLMEKLGFKRRGEERKEITYTFGGTVLGYLYGFNKKEYLEYKKEAYLKEKSKRIYYLSLAFENYEDLGKKKIPYKKETLDNLKKLWKTSLRLDYNTRLNLINSILNDYEEILDIIGKDNFIFYEDGVIEYKNDSFKNC